MPPTPDPWLALRASTRARIGLGRAGDALPIKDILDFQLAHARARDAVFAPLDIDAIKNQLASASVVIRSDAADRATYLRRPDLGRRLDPDCRSKLGEIKKSEGVWDAVFIIADGLSPVAVQQHALPLLKACVAKLTGWAIAPVVIATQARVALGDEIGERIGASFSVVLIGERPGLSVVNSLGVYLTYHPKIGRPDSDRNCISNIHEEGSSYESAADALTWLMNEGRHRKLTGVDLKDDRILQSTPMIGRSASILD